MNRTRTLAVSATLSAAAAIGIFFNTGQMPDAPVGGICTVSWAVGPCEAAVAFSAGDVTCTPGTEVTLPVEVVTTQSEPDDESGTLPDTFIPIASTTVEVDCATLTRPTKALTVVPLEKHGRRVGGYYLLDGSFVEGTGPYCPPIVIAGHIPAGCE